MKPAFSTDARQGAPIPTGAPVPAGRVLRRRAATSFFPALLALALVLLTAGQAPAQFIIIYIVIGGGGGGGGGAGFTRSLASDAVNDLVWAGDYLFLANGARGLQPVDFHDPTLPVRLPALPTGGYCRGIAVLENRAFLAAQEVGVRIIDITVPENPVVVTTLIPTFRRVPRQAHFVAVSTEFLCVGTDNGEMTIFAGPGLTNQVGEIAFGGSGALLALALRDHFAFVTARDAGFQILDLADPVQPHVVGQWPTNGGTLPGFDLAGELVYLTAPGGLQILSLTNLAAPVPVGFTNVPGQLTGVKVAGDFAYVAAGSSGLQILAITNPAAPVLVSSMDTDGFALSVALSGHYAVVADDLGGTTVIDVADPVHPVLVSGVSAGLPPANDAFTNRIVIPPSLCPVEVTGTTRYASKEPGEPHHAGDAGGRSVWWQWTAPFSGPVHISTAGSAFNSLLAIYTGSAVTNLSLVASNDNASASDTISAVEFNAVAGTAYPIAVDGYARDHGQTQLRIVPLSGSGTLAEAADTQPFIWTTGGTHPWIGQNCQTHDGIDAARSGPVHADQQSWMETTVVGPGVVRFWWKISSQENRDALRFTVNDVEQTAISGELNWQQKSCFIGRGTNTLRWTYAKDYAGTSGQDAGWLDEVSFAPSRSAVTTAYGDLDGDTRATVLDLALLVQYLRNTNSLPQSLALFADVNRDGLANSNDIPALASAILERASLVPATDTDGDGIPDVLEPFLGLDPTRSVSSNDSIADADRDFDGDGLTNGRELQLGTDPSRPDSDGDGWWDETELTSGGHPLDALGRPYLMVVAEPSASFLLPANVGAGGLTNNTIVAAPSVALLLPANTGADGLALNTTVASPSLALLLPSNSGPGGLTNNTVVAVPWVSLLLPANEGLGGLTLNTSIASPPVALVLPSNTGLAGRTNNTVLASPPVAFLLPANLGEGGLSNNIVVAKPPVQIELRSP